MVRSNHRLVRGFLSVSAIADPAHAHRIRQTLVAAVNITASVASDDSPWKPVDVAAVAVNTITQPFGLTSWKAASPGAERGDSRDADGDPRLLPFPVFLTRAAPSQMRYRLPAKVSTERRRGSASNTAPAPAQTRVSNMSVPATTPTIAGAAAPIPPRAAAPMTMKLFGPGVIAATVTNPATASSVSTRCQSRRTAASVAGSTSIASPLRSVTRAGPSAARSCGLRHSASGATATMRKGLFSPSLR